jgi:hypothetical protein
MVESLESLSDKALKELSLYIDIAVDARGEGTLLCKQPNHLA